MPPVKQGHMGHFIVQQLGTFSKRKPLNHTFDESNPKVRSSGTLNRGVCQVVEGLTAGFTAITLPSDFSGTCINHIFSESHNRMAYAIHSLSINKNSAAAYFIGGGAYYPSIIL